MALISKCAAAIVITTSVFGNMQNASARTTSSDVFTQDAVPYLITLKEHLSDLQVAECEISMGLYGEDVKSIVPALIYSAVATVPQSEMLSKLSCVEAVELDGQMGILPAPKSPTFMPPPEKSEMYLVTFHENLSPAHIKSCEAGLKKNSKDMYAIVDSLIYSLKATSTQVEVIAAQKACVLAIEADSTMYPTPGIGVSN